MVIACCWVCDYYHLHAECPGDRDHTRPGTFDLRVCSYLIPTGLADAQRWGQLVGPNTQPMNRLCPLPLLYETVIDRNAENNEILRYHKLAALVLSSSDNVVALKVSYIQSPSSSKQVANGRSMPTCGVSQTKYNRKSAANFAYPAISQKI